MELAISKLKDAEVVLMNKIKRMKDGKPKYRAEQDLNELRQAIKVLNEVNNPKAAIAY